MSIPDEPAARLEQKGGESDGRRSTVARRCPVPAARRRCGALFVGGHASHDVFPDVSDGARHAFEQARALDYKRKARLGSAHRRAPKEGQTFDVA